MEVLSKGKRFINDGATAASEAISAVVLSNPDVGLLNFGRVVVRRDYETMKGVKVVSGGESGHEPAYASFVGKGMLAGAIQGDIFKAPAANDILRTIKELSHSSIDGILLIIQNNRGDRFNFGLALERACNDDIRAKMLVVADDCNVMGPFKERRGLSGIILINKIAGAMAEDHKTVEEIVDYCQKLQQEMSSILVCIKPCTAPTEDTCICLKRLGPEDVDFDSGLHGEPGTNRMPFFNVKETCETLISEINNPASPHMLLLTPEQPVVLLVNNLGSTTKLEELIFVRELLHVLFELQVPVSRVYNGKYFTILNTEGFSVTLLKVIDEQIIYYLDFPCNVPAWSNVTAENLTKSLEDRIVCKTRRNFRQTSPIRGPKLNEVQANIFQLVVRFACDALISCERQLNIIDAESGNGDTGTCLRRGVEAIIKELNNKKLTVYHPYTFFESVSKILEVTMGGTLGCVYSILFEAAAKVFSTLSEDHTLTPEIWLKSLKSANKALKKYTAVEIGDCTMYDALYVCEITCEQALKVESSIESFSRGVSACEEAAQKTKVANRRYPDPGAHAVGIWMRAVFEGVKLRCSDEENV